MLHVENLDVFYGDAQALDGVSLEIDEGAIVAIVGANGAGKTSLIRTIAGMHKPSRGRHSIFAAWISPVGRATRFADLGIGQVAEGRQVFPSLSVAENLAMGAMLPRAHGARARNLDRVYALFPALTERSRQARRNAVGRRAADARHWTMSHGRAGFSDVRRALVGLSAHYRAKYAALRARPQSRGPHLRSGRAEHRGLAQAREPRLCAGEQAASRCRVRAKRCSPTTG